MIRNKDGQLRQENPKITEEMENDLVRIRTLMHRAEAMLSLKDHPGWVAVQETFKEKLKAIEKSIDDFSKNEHRTNDLLMQQRGDFKFFLSIVDDFQSVIPKFEQKISEIEKALSERRKEPVQV